MAKPNRVESVAEVTASTDPAASADTGASIPAVDASPASPASTAGKDGVGATKAGNVVMLASGERRVDYIKRRFAAGDSRGAIAKDLGVEYQIVFAATKKPKEAAVAAATGAAVLATAGAAEASSTEPSVA